MMDFFPVPDSSEFGTDASIAPSPSFDPYVSIDQYVSEQDRKVVSHLPEEGKQQFRENVHHYIGQLEKDYPAPEEKGTHIEAIPIIVTVDSWVIAETILEAIRAEGRSRYKGESV